MKTITGKYSILFAAMISICLWRNARAQENVNALSYSAPARIVAKAGASAQAILSIQVAQGYHANSNQPADPYLIPMRLTWSSESLQTVEVVFPKPQLQKLGFSEKPVSVFTGKFDILTRFQVPADAAPGARSITGKLHYQACDDRSCLIPKTVEVTVPVEILK